MQRRVKIVCLISIILLSSCSLFESVAMSPPEAFQHKWVVNQMYPSRVWEFTHNNAVLIEFETDTFDFAGLAGKANNSITELLATENEYKFIHFFDDDSIVYYFKIYDDTIMIENHYTDINDVVYGHSYIRE